MANFPPGSAASISSGVPILTASGLLLELCTEREIESVAGLSAEQKSAMKLAVHTRNQVPSKPLPSHLFAAIVLLQIVCLCDVNAYCMLAAQFDIVTSTPTGGLAPMVHVLRSKVQANRARRDESFRNVLGRPLPFKIPVINLRHVVNYPNIFEYGEAEYDVAIDAWVGAVGDSIKSERTVIGNDLLWQRTLQLLCNLALVLSERDASSETYPRPGFTALCRGALVLKAEAKCDMKDMGTTIKDMIDRFHPCARLLLPDGCAEIPGIATSLQGAAIHRIYCAEGAFQQELVKDYVLLTEMGRVEFICDIFKIALWIEAQVGPVCSTFTSSPTCA
jgi:hypothetical protein